MSLCILILNWKTSHRLGLDYKACFTPPLPSPPLTFHVWCLLMLFRPYFHQFLNYWKGASGFLLLYETRGKILKCVLSVDAPGITQLLTGLFLPTWVFSFLISGPLSPSTHLHLDTKTRFIPSRMPSPTHTVVTLITTSRLAAALIRGSLGRSWLKMCKMVYPQWWFRIVLSLLLCRPALLLARPWGLPREPRAPVLLLELTGSPKSFDFS